MMIENNSKLNDDIKKLIGLGVMKNSIADSMGMSKQAFQYRLLKGIFTNDQAHKFYKHFKVLT